MSLEPTTSSSAWRCLGYRLTENGDGVSNNRLTHPSNIARYAPTIFDVDDLVWGIRWVTEKTSEGKRRWHGTWVRPSADWKYPEEIESTDPVLRYWASIGVDWRVILAAAPIDPSAITPASALSEGTAGASGLFVRTLLWTGVALTRGKTGSLPKLVTKNSSGSPKQCEWLTYRGLDFTQVIPALPEAFFRLRLTSATGSYNSGGISGATIPEPEASQAVSCTETTLGVGGNLTGYKDAEGNISQRYIVCPAILEWSLPLEVQEQSTGLSFTAQNAECLWLQARDSPPYPSPATPGESSGEGGVAIGGTLQAQTILNTLGITGNARRAGSLTTQVWASASKDAIDALEAGGSKIISSLSWVNSAPCPFEPGDDDAPTIIDDD